MEYGELLLVAVALGIGALSKGALGLGLPLLALPLMASFFSLPQAIAVLTVPIIFSNVWQIWQYRAQFPRIPFLPSLAVGGLIGLAIGTAILKYVHPQILEIALGLVLIAYVVLRLARPEMVVQSSAVSWLSPTIGVASGTVQGATGITSPLLVTFLHPLGLPREAFILALSAMFLLFAAAQIPALAVAGLLELEWLAQGLFAVVPVALIMPLGSAAAKRCGQKVFDRTLLVFIVLMGIRFLAVGLGLV